MTILEYNQPAAAYHDYDPQAPVVAQMLVEAISDRNSSLRVEHVGSSSVPGCGGKGYIDLLVIYPEGQLEAAKLALAELGFQRQSSRDPFPEDRPMRVGNIEHAGQVYPVHAHVVASSSPEVDEMIWFRDRLRSDQNAQRAYESEKRRILEEGVVDGVDYAEKKGAFVKSTLAERTASISGTREESQTST